MQKYSPILQWTANKELSYREQRLADLLEKLLKMDAYYLKFSRWEDGYVEVSEIMKMKRVKELGGNREDVQRIVSLDWGQRFQITEEEEKNQSMQFS